MTAKSRSSRPFFVIAAVLLSSGFFCSAEPASDVIAISGEKYILELGAFATAAFSWNNREN